MDDSNKPVEVQSNGTVEYNKTIDELKTCQSINGERKLSNNLSSRQCYPGKTMHMMAPGPKIYQTNKKSPDKEPKFVPYEPYKAAVRSIVPELTQPTVAIFKRRLSTASTCSKASNTVEEDALVKLVTEKQALENDVRKFKEQLKIMDQQMGSQAQINNELKTMLVASIGEDVEAKIQMLTEDKVLLAHKLLNYTGALAGRQDQLETVTGERDVLRSKFLAGSLIIEDLAKWKSFLCDRVDNLEAVLQAVLDENRKNRHLLKSAHENLRLLQNEYKLETVPKQKPLDSITIAEDINRISFLLKQHLIKSPAQELQVHAAVHQTETESRAQQLLGQSLPREQMNNVDATCNAIMEASQALESNIQLCCTHCTGNVKYV